jgi:hypothetical protein
MMELAGSAYLYAIASLAMALVGFSAIVLTLQQITDRRDPKRLKILRQHARGYIELGFSSVGAAILPSALAACGLSATLTWRWSSAIIALGLTYHVGLVFKRFRTIGRSTGSKKMPPRILIGMVVNILVIIAVLLNATGLLFEPNAAPIIVAATWRFASAVIVFMLTYEEFLET